MRTLAALDLGAGFGGLGCAYLGGYASCAPSWCVGRCLLFRFFSPCLISPDAEFVARVSEAVIPKSLDHRASVVFPLLCARDDSILEGSMDSPPRFSDGSPRFTEDL